MFHAQFYFHAPLRRLAEKEGTGAKLLVAIWPVYQRRNLAVWSEIEWRLWLSFQCVHCSDELLLNWSCIDDHRLQLPLCQMTRALRAPSPSTCWRSLCLLSQLSCSTCSSLLTLFWLSWVHCKHWSVPCTYSIYSLHLKCLVGFR